MSWSTQPVSMRSLSIRRSTTCPCDAGHVVAEHSLEAGIGRILLAVILLVAWPLQGRLPFCLADEIPLNEPVTAVALKCGDLGVEFLDNSQSPKILSGVDRLLNLRGRRSLKPSTRMIREDRRA